MRALLRLSLFLCFVGFVMVVPLQAQSSYLNWLSTAGTNDWNTAFELGHQRGSGRWQSGAHRRGQPQ